MSLICSRIIDLPRSQLVDYKALAPIEPPSKVASKLATLEPIYTVIYLWGSRPPRKKSRDSRGQTNSDLIFCTCIR